ncbi:hypothetical protein BX616_003451 [Lobosporangium transversale]|uniref:OTU domain-containing protein n=1 Tax=Lobosporangium transversale TaxID=64571 RepID=A0A1Y2GEP0_9FUNG|nr:hypothetical protein BCR41DRAFT_388475 [Lobosporangium transversale]KAF9898923.1 hypothetical protein BX616_003451 [Lobosporangium transversale]ORZ08743.1 hypothetical protein BCR41DRAFT_388475 [Lobosporangium transversale]|eukprot:XP_021878526.1 hypothetical protein BCR41DRAFT_388475 [Lobosporangium transversale]
MSPVKTRSTSSKHQKDRGYKADPEDTNDDDDFYGMRELKHQLAGLNLQLKDTMGDGNCLFRACADQFYGNERDHAALRAEVCQYIEDHTDHFKSFLDNVTVEAHVAHMRKNGTYGGNIELVAFARMKRVDIKVYQPGYIYVIEGVDVKKEGSGHGQRPIMHIAYHSWEHYSSIRNIDGPHEGLPEINPRPIKQQPLAKLTDQDPPRSIERVIMKVSGVQDLGLVRDLMEKYHGDFDSVVNDLAERAYEEANEECNKNIIIEPANTDADVEASNEETESNGKPIGNVLEGEEEEEEEEEEKKKKKESLQESIEDKTDANTKDHTLTRAKLDGDSGTRSVAMGTSWSSSDLTDSDPSVSVTGSSKPSSRAATPTLLATSSRSRTASPVPPIALSDEPVKGVVPKKRISSREKKELAKRNQKLNKKNRGKVNVDYLGN